MLSHLRLVVSVSRQYLGYGLPHGDLIQEGNIGLMKAVKRFDPDQGVRLVSYALHWIKAEIHEYILKNWRMVKVATTKAQRKLFFNLRSMKQGFKDDAPTPDAPRHADADAQIDAMARELNVKREEVARDGNAHVRRRRRAGAADRRRRRGSLRARSPTWPTTASEPTRVHRGAPARRAGQRRHRRGAGRRSMRAAAASSRSAG